MANKIKVIFKGLYKWVPTLKENINVVTRDEDTQAHLTSKGGYLGFDEATGNYLRTPVNGLIPNVDGINGYIGTSGWRFSNGFFNYLDVSNSIRSDKVAPQYIVCMAGNEITFDSSGEDLWFGYRSGSNGVRIRNWHIGNGTGGGYGNIIINSMKAKGDCWLGSQYASGGDWMGWYSSYGGSRRGYIQHDTVFRIVNEVGTGEIVLNALGKEIHFESTSGNYDGYFYPKPSSRITLGTTTYRWYRLYQSYASIDTSDERYKKDIQSFDERYENFFMDLNPIHHKWKNFNKNDRHDRKHGAFIAQNVKKALYDNNLTEMDFGFYCYDKVSDNENLPFNDLHSLAYTEMIPLNTHMIQKLYKIVEQQQKEIDELKEQIKSLKDQSVQ